MNPLEGQQEDPQPPMKIDGQQEWEVRRIVASRIWRGKLQYRAEWKGYDEDKEFYDAEGFKGCPHKLRQFHEDHKDAAGPPKRLREWLTAWEKGQSIDENEEDNAVGSKQPGKARKTRRHVRG